MHDKIPTIRAREELRLLNVTNYSVFDKETRDKIHNDIVEKAAFPETQGKGQPYWMDPKPGLHLVNG
jgi:hypothetical protein